MKKKNKSITKITHTHINRKEAIIIAGANGSGKTVFAKEYLKNANYKYLNADEIALKLSPHDLSKARLTAGRIFLKNTQALIQKGKSFILETTMSGLYLEKIFKALKKNSYSITIIFIFLESPEVCINRIKERVLKGGHDVPKEDITRRFYRGISNFWGKYRYFADKWYIIENSHDGFQEIATGFNNTQTVNDERLYRKFTAILEKGQSIK